MATIKLTLKQYEYLASADADGRLSHAKATSSTRFSLRERELTVERKVEGDNGRNRFAYYVTDAGRAALAAQAAPKQAAGTPTEDHAAAARVFMGVVFTSRSRFNRRTGRNEVSATGTDVQVQLAARPLSDYQAGQQAFVQQQGAWRKGIVVHTTKSKVHVLTVNPTSGAERVKKQTPDMVRLASDTPQPRSAQLRFTAAIHDERAAYHRSRLAELEATPAERFGTRGQELKDEALAEAAEWMRKHEATAAGDRKHADRLEGEGQ